jgi:hypothetical protein
MEQLNALIGLYGIASKQLVPFGANLKFDDKKRDKEINSIYDAAISKTFGNDYFPCNDEYLLKGYEAGVFDENGLEVFEHFYEHLIRPLNEQLPDYFI